MRAGHRRSDRPLSWSAENWCIRSRACLKNIKKSECRNTLGFCQPLRIVQPIIFCLTDRHYSSGSAFWILRFNRRKNVRRRLALGRFRDWKYFYLLNHVFSHIDDLHLVAFHFNAHLAIRNVFEVFQDQAIQCARSISR